MDDHELQILKESKEKIKINKGSGVTFDKLKDCFFYPVKGLDGIYLLCNEFGVTLTVVTGGQPFMFEHGGLIWKVPNPAPNSEPFTISSQAGGGDPVQTASGSFWNNDRTAAQDDTGTFSAQSSGGADDDASASYAAAN